MKTFINVNIFVLAVITAVASVSYAAEAVQDKKFNRMILSKSSVNLTLTMRKLWEEHITYTRNYIISALADLEDINNVTARLLRNQDDIGGAIKPIYGDEAGEKLSELLKEHIIIATEVVKAAKMEDEEGLAGAYQKWFTNADDIAAFLSETNPNWDKRDLEDILHRHLEYTTQEIISRVKKDWASDIEGYDLGHDHILMLADALTEGIVSQFPEKFQY